MLDTSYIQSIQSKLTNFYKNHIDNKDDHHITVYTSANSNDGFIIYQPNWMADHHDNDGKTMPQRYVIIHAITKNGRTWSRLINQQFIHSQRLTGNKYEWNLNYRRDNDISFTGQRSLKKYLANQFSIHITKTGLLVSNVSNKFIPAFENMILAIQYLNHYGYDYICAKHISDKEMDSIVRKRQSQLHSERMHVSQEKRKHASTNTKRQSGPKAPGKIVHATSSIDGTPRVIRLRHEAKKRKQREIYLKEHPQLAKQEHEKHIKISLKRQISHSKIVTIGRFSVSHSKIVQLIKKCGGTYQVNINSNTNFVLANKPSSSKKYKIAMKKHIPIINENELRSLLSK